MNATYDSIRLALEARQTNELNETILQGRFLITDIRLRTCRSGAPYLQARLSDREAEVNLVAWNFDGPLHFSNGDVVEVVGKVDAYNGKPQLVAEFVDPIQAEEITPEDLRRLVPIGPINTKAAIAYVGQVLDSMEDEAVASACEAYLCNYWEEFTTYPAAMTVHHAFRHGLLMHTTNMLHMAEAVLERYPGTMDRDLLLSGVLLHDVGKVKEFDVHPVTGIIRSYTTEGTLLGHSYLEATEFDAIAEFFGVDGEKRLILQHMLLSHHGDPEMGAAKRPMTLEAETLHLLDMLDSRHEIYREKLRDVPEGAFSDYIPSLEKALYRHGHQPETGDREVE